MPMQQFSWRHLSLWHVGFLPLFLLLGAGFLYWWAARRAGHWPRWFSVMFLVGLVVTFIATESVVGYFDMEYFSDHMVQHLLLIMVAGPLFALSRPLDLAYEVGSKRVRAFFDGDVMKVVTHPLFAFVLYFVFIPLTHLTGLFNLMLEHEWVHHIEQIGFLVVGYLFFRAAFCLERGFTLHPGLRLVYVMAAVPVDTFTGLALDMTSHDPFPTYLHTSPMGSTKASILANVHLGGAVMWIGGDALMLLACIPVAVAWVRWETARTKVLDAELDRQGI
jgi:putative membrane protein